MKLDPPALRQVVARTLEHYHSRAEAFWEGTRNHDVAQNIEALLRHIQAAAPYTILDFGCVPKTHPSNIVLGLALLVSTIVAGAAFCGWICPTPFSTGCSPMLPCSTYRCRSCRASCDKCARR